MFLYSTTTVTEGLPYCDRISSDEMHLRGLHVVKLVTIEIMALYLIRLTLFTIESWCASFDYVRTVAYASWADTDGLPFAKIG